MPVTALLTLKRYWREVLLALACALFFYSGYQLKSYFVQMDELEQMQQAAEQRRKQELERQRQDASLQAKLTALEEAHRNLNRRLARETSDPAYRCFVPLTGLQLRDEARRAGSAPGGVR